MHPPPPTHKTKTTYKLDDDRCILYPFLSVILCIPIKPQNSTLQIFLRDLPMQYCYFLDHHLLNVTTQTQDIKYQPIHSSSISSRKNPFILFSSIYYTNSLYDKTMTDCLPPLYLSILLFLPLSISLNYVTRDGEIIDHNHHLSSFLYGILVSSLCLHTYLI